MRFTVCQRVLFTLVGMAGAIVGFMIKLPAGFRHIDKELHAVFYFLAAAFLNVLFARTNLLRHGLVFLSLYGFGMGIEYFQAYSNRFFRTRIHGRFDPEDLQANLQGLLAFSLLWLLATGAILLYRSARPKSGKARSNRTSDE